MKKEHRNQMKRILPLLSLSLLFLIVSTGDFVFGNQSFNNGIEIKDSWLYLKGEKFFINAVGYAGWRSAQWPGTDKVDLKLVNLDFKRIKEAGFNTIRSWAALSPDELALAKKYDLMVIQGIWIDPTHDYSDVAFIEQALEQIKQEVSWSKDFDNVIMYLVITEPTQEAVLFAGEEKTIDFFKKIKETVKQIDNKPVSMDSWIPLGFLDHSLWDVVTFNAFMFTPEPINRAIGFKEYVKWIRENHARNKPLFIGETGGFSVSKKKLNDIGFGGNSQSEQSKEDIESINQSIAAGASGVCTVAWIDTWHYPSDPNAHDDHPWEWDGILGIPTKNDLEGIPRLVYYDLKRYNQAIIIEPRQAEVYYSSAPISIYASDSIENIRYRIDNSKWQTLSKQNNHWWIGNHDLKDKKGIHRLDIICRDNRGAAITRKSVDFFISEKIEALEPRIKISIIPDKQTFSIDDVVSLKIKLTDLNNKPLAKEKVAYGLFSPLGWKEEYASGITNEEGELYIKSTLKLERQTQYPLLTVGVIDTESPYKNRYSAIEFLAIKAPQEAKEGKSSKPFAVYLNKSYPSNHYIPSGWTGDYEDLGFDAEYANNPHSGNTCIKITYSAKASHGGGWAGIYWQNPLNNWGQIKGGFSLKGATKLTFWARGDKGGERIEEFGMGWPMGDYPDSDTAKIEKIVLTKDWRKYIIDITDKNLAYISCGFYFFVRKEFNPKGCTFYLDDITYE
ncbi:MAG: hypothetical protein NC923_07000 [Candidatus Omnitrophica bacterium]|nr:hypothetical protein [Candidatus Omnitrophota bacterium]